jgi:hypothetical protein
MCHIVSLFCSQCLQQGILLWPGSAIKSTGIVIPENLDISRVISTGLSPKRFFVTGVIERMGVFYATTIRLLPSFTTPAPYVSCIGQAACRVFDKGNVMGSGTA